MTDGYLEGGHFCLTRWSKFAYVRFLKRNYLCISSRYRTIINCPSNFCNMIRKATAGWQWLDHGLSVKVFCESGLWLSLFLGVFWHHIWPRLLHLRLETFQGYTGPILEDIQYLTVFPMTSGKDSLNMERFVASYLKFWCSILWKFELMAKHISLRESSHQILKLCHYLPFLF